MMKRQIIACALALASTAPWAQPAPPPAAGSQEHSAHHPDAGSGSPSAAERQGASQAPGAGAPTAPGASAPGMMGGGMMGGGMMGPGMMGPGMMGRGMMGRGAADRGTMGRDMPDHGMMGRGMMDHGMMHHGAAGDSSPGAGSMDRGVGRGTGAWQGALEGPRASMRMLASLGLTDDQYDRVQRIHDDLRRRSWDLMGRMMDERAKLRDLYSAPVFDRSALGTVYWRIGEIRQQLIAARLDAHAAVEQLLTPEQRTRLRQHWRAMARAMG